MSNETNNGFWRPHLAGIENPLVHFVPFNLIDIEVLRRASSELRFAFFPIDVRQVASVPALMDDFAKAMSFPPYFGCSWDALHDSMTDLSWSNAKGYVLVLSNADSLLSLPNNGFSVLVRVLEATVRGWRDGRGEYGERTTPVPFHVIFSGSDALREALVKESKEPLCNHEAGLSVHVVRTPGGIGDSENFHDAEKLIKSGADPELVLSFLRERGEAEVDSIYALASLMGKSIPEAKALADNSQTWSDRYETDARIREAARNALRELGFL